MTITPEDIDEICNRIVVNTMRRELSNLVTNYEAGIILGIFQKKLIENLVFSFKAKLEVLPGQANAPQPEIDPMDRFGAIPDDLLPKPDETPEG